MRGARAPTALRSLRSLRSVGLTEHFDDLLAALASPACALRELRLIGCDWPEGRRFAELVEALPARGLKILNTEGMGLTGEIPPLLFDKCAEALIVDLCMNAFSGAIPASIGRCGKLEKLLVWKNQLVAPVPAEIANCVKLQQIELQDNKFTGSWPTALFGGMTDLQNLSMEWNAFDGVLTSELAQCTRLEILDCIPRSIEDAPNGSAPGLLDNRCTGVVPSWLGGFPNLRMLRLNGGLEGPIPDALANCTNLTNLNLSNNRLTGSIPPWLGSCSKLVKLNLHDNRLSGAVPAAALAQLTKLKVFRVHGNAELTITRSGQELMKGGATPKCVFAWPEVILEEHIEEYVAEGTESDGAAHGSMLGSLFSGKWQA